MVDSENYHREWSQLFCYEGIDGVYRKSNMQNKAPKQQKIP